MSELDVTTLKWIMSIAGALAGWIALRLENFGHRLVRVETKLDNGISEKLEDVKSTLAKHIDGEERRILQAVRRDPGLRTRKTDRRRREEVDDA